MNFLKKLFKGQNALEALQNDIRQRQWARALGRSAGLEDVALSEEERTERDALRAQAHRGLAELNLEEGEAFLRARQWERALEHLELAQPHVEENAKDLQERMRVLQELAREQRTQPVVHQPVLSKSCAGCGPVKSGAAEDSGPAEALEREVELELVLSSYSPETAQRYLAKSDEFKDAFLLAQAGENESALKVFNALDAAERDELFFFERGSLLLRSGQVDAARNDLETAYGENPDSLPVFVTLVDLERHAGRRDRLRQLLSEATERIELAPFAHQSLAVFLAESGDPEGALAEGEKALDLGVRDAALLELLGRILESRDALERAEACFEKIPAGGGCSGGGTSLPLAAFWLRQGKNPDKVIDAFNKALKVDPHNPGLLLQLAEAYNLKGWKRQGREIVEAILRMDSLEAGLQARATALQKEF